MSESRPTEYFMLDSRDAEDTMLLRSLQDVGGVTWYSGRRFTAPVPDPLYVDIVEGYESDTVPLSYNSNVPLMRDDLLACLKSNRADNIDSYPGIIRNTVTGEETHGYSAINIIGLVRAADPAETFYYEANPSRLIDADIDSLAIDAKRAHGFLLFRLAECVTGVVVHEKLRRAVEADGRFPDTVFLNPKDWMG
jgi:hypothetical protein